MHSGPRLLFVWLAFFFSAVTGLAQSAGPKLGLALVTDSTAGRTYGYVLLQAGVTPITGASVALTYAAGATLLDAASPTMAGSVVTTSAGSITAGLTANPGLTGDQILVVATFSGTLNPQLAIGSVQLNSGSVAATLDATPAAFDRDGDGKVDPFGPPVIKLQTRQATVEAGDTARLSVRVAANPAPSFQWRRNNLTLESATTAALELAAVQVAQAGTYDVVVTNAKGSTTSRPIVLSVKETIALSGQPPDQPAGLTVTSVGATRFTVNWAPARGAVSYDVEVSKTADFIETLGYNDLGYNDLGYNDLGENTNAVLAREFTDLDPATQYYYRVVAISNERLTATSSTLTVTTLAATAPTITAQPVAQVASVGQTVSLSVSAGGAPALRYAWRRGTTALAAGTTATLTLANVQSADAGAYTVTVANDFGSVTSVPAQLAVTTGPAAPRALAATDVTQTSFSVNWVPVTGVTSYDVEVSDDPGFQNTFGYNDLSVTTGTSFPVTGLLPGQRYYYRVSALGTAGAATLSNEMSALTVPGTPLATGATGVGSTAFTAKWRQVTGATSFEVEVTRRTAPTVTWRETVGNEGQGVAQRIRNLVPEVDYCYRVRAGNVSGWSPWSAGCSEVTTRPAGAPTIVTEPVSLTVNSGAAANFSVVADASPAPTYAWYRNDQLLAGRTAATLSLASALAADAGRYHVVVTNNKGATTSEVAILTVATGLLAPKATPATLVTAGGFTANWTAVAGATAYDLEVSRTADFTEITRYRDLPANPANRVLTGLLPGRNYFYRVLAKAAGSAGPFSNIIPVVTVPAAPLALPASAVGRNTFTANWTGMKGASDYILEVSRNASFTDLLGYNDLGYNDLGYNDLHADGEYPAEDGDDFAYNDSGRVIQREVIVSLLPATTYYYRVVAVNASGTGAVSNPITVTTSQVAAPVIATTLLPRSVEAGSAVTFSVQATGDGLLSYRWRRNGVDLPNATTAALTLNPVQTTDAGLYDVVVSNAAGGTASNAVALTVTVGLAAPVALAPTDLTATSFVARWSAVAGATGYDFEVATNPEFTAVLGYNDLSVDTTINRVVQNLQPGRTYYFRVAAYDDLRRSAYSNIMAVTTLAAVKPAITLQPSSRTVTAGTAVTLSVGASGTGPLRYAWTKNGVSVPAGTTASLQFTAVQAGDAGTYRVVVSNDAGNATSADAVLTVTAALVAPQAQAATMIGATGFTANWTAVSGASSYDLEVSTSSTFTETLGYNDLNASVALSRPVTGLLPDTNYYFRVTAQSVGGVSPPSNVIQVRTLPAGAPTITTPPQAISVNAGATVTLSVVATGEGPLAYQWKKDGQNVGSGGASLILTTVQTSQAGVYSVVVTNAKGSTTSVGALVAVIAGLVPPAALPATAITATGFTANWTAVTGAIGYDVEVSTAEDFSDVLGYNDLGSGTATSKAFTGLDPGTVYYYRVSAQGLAGTSDVSKVIKVVTIPAAPTVLPATAVTATGFTANWSAVAGAGDYVLELSRNSTFTDLLGYNDLGYNDLGYNDLGAGGTRSEVVSGLTPNTTYYYRVTALNDSGSGAASGSMAVTTPPREVPTIVLQPVPQSVEVGATVTFTVAATGEGQISYRWRRNGVDVPNGAGATLTLTAVQPGNAGLYDVVVSNAAGAATSRGVSLVVAAGLAAPVALPPTNITGTGFTANWSTSVGATGYDLEVSSTPDFAQTLGYNDLNVGVTQSRAVTGLLPGRTYYYRVAAQDASRVSAYSNVMSVTTVAPDLPVITQQPKALSLTAGAAASFTVVATGTGPFSYQWLKDGVLLPGANGASLSLTSVQPADSGAYAVRITGPGGAVLSAEAALVVRVPPAIVSQPLGLTVIQGQKAVFAVTATGVPAPTYQWYRDGGMLSGSTGATLTIASALPVHEGQYTVVIGNGAGDSLTSAAALLTVHTPPVFTTSPLSRSVTVGGNVTLTATASGKPAPVLQWRKGGVDLPGQTGTTLALSNLQTVDSGTSYSVWASNGVGPGVSSEPAVITVNLPVSAPVIQLHPVDAAIEPGGTATFAVVATGNPSPSYEWRRNKSPISGATGPTYLIPNVKPIDAASYDVRVFSSEGQVISNPALLSLRIAPAVEAQPVNLTVNQGQPAAFTVAVSGQPVPRLQWRKDGVIIAGATDAKYEIAAAKPGDEGLYSVVAGNGIGAAVSSSPALLTVNTPPVVTAAPASQTVEVGGNVTLVVRATGKPAPSYQWRRGTDLVGTNSPTYTVSNLQLADSGASFTVAISNGVGAAVVAGPAVITVTAAAFAPSVTVQPANVAAVLGEGASFSVVASGNPAPTYQWRRNGANLAGAVAATLNLAAVAAADAGSYDVVVTNSAGATVSQPATLTVKVAAAIVTPPAALTVVQGQPARLGVTASGQPAPSYQWMKDGVAIPGALDATLLIGAAQAADEGSYTVVIRNGVGAPVTSAAAALTVHTPPVVTTALEAATVLAGESFSFNVTAAGKPGLSYVWKHNSAVISGASSANLSLGKVSAADAGDYEVTVSNSAGVAVSGPVALTVHAPPVLVAPPSALVVKRGDAAAFSVTATGSPAPRFQWFKDGVALAGATGATLSLAAAQPADEGSYSVVINNGIGQPAVSPAAVLTVNTPPVIIASPASATGVTGGSLTLRVLATGKPEVSYLWRKGGAPVPGGSAASLVFNPLVANDAGSYDVVVTNAAGSVTSSAASVVVQQAPAISAQPAAVTVTKGQAAEFVVVASGQPAVSFQWTRDGVPLAGATEATFRLPSAQPEDEGVYRVVVSNGVGTPATSAAAPLVVNESPIIRRPPLSQSVAAGGNVTLNVAVTAKPAPAFQWYRGGSAIEGATQPALTLTNLQAADSGTSFTVTVTNGIGASITSPAAVITVTAAPYPPVITLQPVSQAVDQGGTVTLTVQARGNPAPSFQWRRNGSLIAATAASLTITGAATTDAGSYDVVVSNSEGSVSSQAAVVSVNTPVAIVTQPAPVTVARGEKAMFQVVATGSPAPTFQWRRDGAVIPEGTAAVHHIASAQPADEGVYSVVITNGIGPALTSEGAALAVNAGPLITVQPQSQTVVAGGSLTLKVVATGRPALAYQWRRDGAAIAGATAASLPLQPVGPAAAGSYDVVVSNSLGTATSQPASIVVHVPPVIVTQPVNQTVAPGTTANLVVVATGTPSLSYQWRRAGTAITGATTPALSLTRVQTGDSGNYDVVVTNAAGSVTSSVAVLTVAPQPDLEVQGKGRVIAAGDLSPTEDDDTDFASVGVGGSGVTRTYILRNAGTAALNFTGNPRIELSGSESGDFAVFPPESASLAAGAATTFDLTFNPGAPGLRRAEIRIVSNDPDEPVYRFAIQGRGATGVVPAVPLAPDVAFLVSPVTGGLALNVSITFPSGGYVIKWGEPRVAGKNVLIDPEIYGPPAGSLATQAFTTHSHAYALGALPSGTYRVLLTSWGTNVKADTFTVASVAGSAGTAGSGSVVIGSAAGGAGAVVSGSAVSLTATPAPGYRFSGWNFESGTQSVSLSANPLQTVISADAMVTAMFVPDNAAPVIGVIPDQAVTSGSSVGPIAFSVGDAETAAGSLTLSAASSVPALLASTGITFGGSGANRTVTLTPATGQTGVAVITVTVADGGGLTAARSFALMVNAPAGTPASITSGPAARAVRLNGSTNFVVGAAGTGPLGYLWKKDGQVLADGGRVSGASTSSLSITGVQFADAGSYTVQVTGAVGAAALSTAAPLAVVNAQQTAASGYVAGGTVRIDNEITYVGAVTEWRWQVVPPEGWKFAAGSGADGNVKPDLNSTGPFEWVWTSVPASPVKFAYTVNVPVGTSGTREFRALLVFKQSEISSNILVLPDPLVVAPQPQRHSADTDGNFRISLQELTRVIELYNTRLGTLRTGRYKVQVSPVTEDGFAADAVSTGTQVLAAYHTADTNRDGQIGLTELTRVIELYNYREGTQRTGQYRVATTATEDGFAPGP